MIGKLDNGQIDALLMREIVGRIGCNAEGVTYVVPITYVFKDDHIYGHTKEGKKIEMMRKNAMVCFEVDHIVDMRNWQSAVIQGEYEELKGDQADQAMGELINRLMPITTSETGPLKYGMQHPHPELISTAKPVVFKIHILEKSGRYEKS